MNVEVTNAAAKIIHSLIQEEEKPDLSLRVFIQGGGCSGFQYGFMFDAKVADDDVLIEKAIGDSGDSGDSGGSGVIQVLIDPLSFQYLTGSEIDYQEDLQGARFVIRNPNAKTTCGCGSSFGV